MARRCRTPPATSSSGSTRRPTASSALLDGRQNVAEVWRICQDQLGDAAPTQGEAIQLLGQLYTSNLLHAELPPDAEGLFNRYQKRVHREVQGYLMNLLFIRIPLFDPDRFLDAWVGAVSWLFSWFGFVLWLGLIGTGLYFAVDNWRALCDQGQSVLDPEQPAVPVPELRADQGLPRVRPRLHVQGVRPDAPARAARST